MTGHGSPGAECQLHEALLNVALRRLPRSGCCALAILRRRPGEVIEEGRRAHRPSR
jgi:hypothetical protein